MYVVLSVRFVVMYGTGRSRIRIPGKAKAEVNKIKFAVIGC